MTDKDDETGGTASEEAPFDEVLDSIASTLDEPDGDSLTDAEIANLREDVARISDASLDDLLAAAGFDHDDLGPTDVPRLLASSESEGVNQLRTLLDLADLGDDADSDDPAFVERLDSIVDDDGPGDDSPDDETDAERDEPDSDPEDDDPTVADLFSGASTLLNDWSNARQSASDAVDSLGGVADHEGMANSAANRGGEGEGTDEDGGFLGLDDLASDLAEKAPDDDPADDKTGSRRTTRNRFSSMPSRRTDMSGSGRFSSIKGRK